MTESVTLFQQFIVTYNQKCLKKTTTYISEIYSPPADSRIGYLTNAIQCFVCGHLRGFLQSLQANALILF
jgi:hypothetical protein